jgi:hypothetical protein
MDSEPVGKGLFLAGEKAMAEPTDRPPFGVGFVYDTPLKNFPPF